MIGCLSRIADELSIRKSAQGGARRQAEGQPVSTRKETVMRARQFRVVAGVVSTPVAAVLFLPALNGQALALLPTVIKFEWTVPGHGYSLVAVHGPLQGSMQPGHFDVVVDEGGLPSSVWRTRLSLFTSATP